MCFFLYILSICGSRRLTQKEIISTQEHRARSDKKASVSLKGNMIATLHLFQAMSHNLQGLTECTKQYSTILSMQIIKDDKSFQNSSMK